MRPGHPPADAAHDRAGRGAHRPAVGHRAAAQGPGEPVGLHRQAPGVAPAGRGRRRPAGRAGQGYVLDVDPEAVDLHQFRRLRRQADALAASGDYDHAAALLREADGLWRGQALAGIRGDWVARMRDSLEEERRAAILERVECELELGRHADLVGELRHLLAQYPLDETFIAHQMTALYRSGRPGDALSLYRETRSRLDRGAGHRAGAGAVRAASAHPAPDPELAVRPAGRRPGQAARAGHAAARDGGVRGPRRGTRRCSPGSTATPPGQRHRGHAGRGQDRAGGPRGPRWSPAQYPDGTFYLNLHTHDPGRPSLDSAEALHRLLRMLTVPATQIPDAIGERAALWRAQLSRRRAVVILDDAARQDQIRPLLPVAGRCLILITTRRRLPDLEGARALTLDVLPAGDAVTLFRRSPARAGPRPGRGGRGRGAVRAPAAGDPARRRPARAGPPARPGRPGRGAVPVPGRPGQHRRGQPGGDVRLRPVLPRAGTRPPAVLPAAGREPVRRRSACRPAAALGGCTLAEAEKALAALLDHHLLVRDAGRPVPLPRPHPRVRGRARRAG